MSAPTASAGPAPAAVPVSERLTLAGLVLVITVVAVEAMAVATAMPTVARSLHGLGYYGWAFTAYLLADIVGMVVAGSRADRIGPRQPLVIGLALFSAGLLVDGLAPSMPVFLTGRALQGLGGGQLIVAAYVLIARVFPPERQPRVFTALSAAWVVPAVVGPAAAGAVTDALGWRWVFFGIAPLAALGALMLVPVLASAGSGSGQDSRRIGALGGLLLAIGLALVQTGGQRLDITAPPLVLGGLALLAVPLRRTLPPGSLRLRRGLPTLVVLRGVFALSFFGAEAYLPLTLSRLHGGSPTTVGIPLTFAALGWALGAWVAGRPAAAARPLLLARVGFVVVAAGVASLVVVTWPSVTLWAAAPLWAVAGTGMGLGYSTVSVQLLAMSPPHEQGANSAALQVCDVIGSITGVALAATLVAVAGHAHLATAMRVADPVLAAGALCGVALSGRALRHVSAAQ